jgi:hypothetical protein
MKAFSWRDWLVYSLPIYLGVMAVGTIAFWLSYKFSENGGVAIVSAIPGAGALIGALFQIFRDKTAFDHSRILQNENNDFILSATSHMANKAFDKHVEFSEEYLPMAESRVIKLFQAMPAEENMRVVARKLADDLFGVRKKFSLWVTEEIRIDLEPFEKALRKMDGLAGLIASRDPSDQQGKLVETFFATLKKIGDVKDNEKDAVAEEGAIRLKEILQKILGIPELTLLRRRYVEEATRRSKK